MRIKGTEVTHRQVEVDIDAGEMLEALRKKVYQSVGIPYDAYLSLEGQIVEDDDCGHGSPITRVIVAEPNENQLGSVLAFRHIYKMLIRD
jgi:hypothetical protein